MAMFLTHLGTATLLLEIGPFRLLTDPALGPRGTTGQVLGVARYKKNESPVTLVDPLDRLDGTLISHHHHIDNLDPAGWAIARRSKVVLSTLQAARDLGAPVRGLAPWDTVEIKTTQGDSLKITATPAQHGPAFLNRLTGPVVGFVIESPEFKNGAIYITGDTVYFNGIQEVARRFKIGTLIPHAGRAHFGVTPFIDYTMSAEGAVQVIEAIQPKTVLPVHYAGWSHFKEGKNALQQAFTAHALPQTIKWLPLGQKTDIDV